MHIHNVVSVGLDEEHYFIECGITLNCAVIKISRECEIRIEVLNGEMVVVIIK